MNRITKRLTSLALTLLFLLALLPGGAAAASVASGSFGKENTNLTWTLDSAGTLTISGSGSMGGGYEIFRPWNGHEAEIRKVVIKQGVTDISHYMFKDCVNLASITVPSTVTRILQYAFYGCSALTGISIPDGVTEIGSYAFNECSGLKSVKIPAGVTVIGDYTFYNCTSLESVTLQDGLTGIGDCAFAGCSSLKSVNFPASVRSIGNSAFSFTDMTSVTIPEGVTKIGQAAFALCPSLQSVTIPASVTSISTYPFEGCTSLTAINVSADNPNYSGAGGVLFNKDKTKLMQFPCGKKGGYTVPGSVKTISLRAFRYAAGLTQVTIPAGDTSITIDSLAFADSPSLKTVKVLGNCSINSSAFSNCTALTDVELAEGSILDHSVFEGCTALSYLTVPSGTKRLGMYLFRGCASLTAVSIPESVTSIESGVFEGCTSLSIVNYAGSSEAWDAVKVNTYLNEPLENATMRFDTGGSFINSLTANVTGAGIGDTITWTASIMDASGALSYCFYIYRDTKVVFKGSYGDAKQVSYTADYAGAYSAKVFFKDSTGVVRSITSGTTTVAVYAEPIEVSIKPSKDAVALGDTVTWIASASGGVGALSFCFYVYNDKSVIQKGSYGSDRYVSYTITQPGQYYAKVFVKDSAGSTKTALSYYFTIEGTQLPLYVSSIKADKTTAVTGDTLTWTAAASGGSGNLQYCFYVYKDGKIVSKGAYGSARTFSYQTAAAGSYTAKVFVKDAAGNAANQLSGMTSVKSETATITDVSIKTDKTAAKVGDLITWTASASGAGTLQYCFYVYKDGRIVKKGAYGSAKTFSYTPDAPGSYTAKVFVKNAYGTASLGSVATKVTEASAPITIGSIKADKTAARVGDVITWTAAASGGSGSLQYCFYVYKDGGIVKKGAYGSARTFSYTPEASGSYSAKVFVKDTAGNSASMLSSAASVTTESAPITVGSIKADKTAAKVGEAVTWTAAASGGSGSLQYCFYVYKDGRTVKKGAYGSAKTFSYTPETSGSYSAKIFVKDAFGSVSLMSAATKVSG